jgi:hypothetical protein
MLERKYFRQGDKAASRLVRKGDYGRFDICVAMGRHGHCRKKN